MKKLLFFLLSITAIFLFTACKTEDFRDDYIVMQVLVDNVSIKPSYTYTDDTLVDYDKSVKSIKYYYNTLSLDQEFEVFYFLLKDPDIYVEPAIEYRSDYLTLLNIDRKAQRIKFKTKKIGNSSIVIKTKKYGSVERDIVVNY